ncbi:MAG: CDP-alcohol phosphatidyltransferase family protein [Ruminococcaceae bacterium]|nr:CDP-alcohol phosphatidyltransferase family protein [Oscillospiraceae bacterium]
MELFKKYLKQAKTIPNILSFIRIALIPVFCVLMISAMEGEILNIKKFVIGIVIFAVAGLTDLFDGKIARKYNQVTDLGKMLDPVADKLTQFAVAIILMVWFWGDWLFIGLFSVYIIKEVFQLIAGVIMLSRYDKPMQAAIWGKVSTVVFYIVMIIMFLTSQKGVMHQLYLQGFLKFDFVMPIAVLYILVGISVIFMFMAFFSYIPAYVEAMKHTNQRGLEEVILAALLVLIGLFMLVIRLDGGGIQFAYIAGAFFGSAVTLVVIGVYRLKVTSKLPKGDPLEEAKEEKTKEIGDK